jgi:TonB family protein
VYPPAASRAGVEGTVEFNAAVNIDGTVAEVDIVSVPSPNVGFEESVREAVRHWRFAAATRDGTAVAGTYHGTVQFQLAIPGEWMYPVSSHDVWVQVRELIRELKLPTERVEDDHQLLITRSFSDRASMPDAGALGLRSGQLPDTIRFHVYVAPGVEPARVAIGSTIQTRSMANRREAFLVYANVAASNWLEAELTKRVGKAPEPLSSVAARRAEQSRRLMPPGASDPCSGREAVLLSGDRAEGVQYPRVFSVTIRRTAWHRLH